MSGTRLLREVVERRIDERWSDFAAAHPHLAEVIDRTRLVDSAADRLDTDAELRAAMRDAGLDEATLAAAARVLERAESIVDRMLPT